MNVGSQDGVPCYMLEDKGHPLFLWLMTLHKERKRHTILKLLYNHKHKKGRSAIENAFRVLKQTFQKLLEKT
jgi:hypothetical protein